jgi:hypothetical protein
MERLNPWYVTGFSDGESAFTYSRSGNNLSLYFAIKLNFEDRNLLYQIKDFFGVGKIYVGRPVLPGKHSGYTKTSFYYRVSKISELSKVIEHFDKYPPIGKKASTYPIWKEMVALKKEYRKPNKAELNRLADKISALTSKNNKLKNKNGQNISVM